MPRRLSIPKRLTVKGRRWRVSVTGARGRRKRADMRGLSGLCDDETRTIWLDATEPRRTRELTLVHEVLHAMFPPGIVDAETEERIVRGMEAPAHALLLSGVLVPVPEEVP